MQYLRTLVYRLYDTSRETGQSDFLLGRTTHSGNITCNGLHLAKLFCFNPKIQ